MWYKNVSTSFFRFVTKHVFDRRTDRRRENEKPLQYRALHYMESHGKKTKICDRRMDHRSHTIDMHVCMFTFVKFANLLSFVTTRDCIKT